MKKEKRQLPTVSFDKIQCLVSIFVTVVIEESRILMNELN
jgi:hypothetical protein